MRKRGLVIIRDDAAKRKIPKDLEHKTNSWSDLK